MFGEIDGMGAADDRDDVFERHLGHSPRYLKIGQPAVDVTAFQKGYIATILE
jgi:hypothetical protein